MNLDLVLSDPDWFDLPPTGSSGVRFGTNWFDLISILSRFVSDGFDLTLTGSIFRRLVRFVPDLPLTGSICLLFAPTGSIWTSGVSIW